MKTEFNTTELREDELEAFEIYVEDGNEPNVDEFREVYYGYVNEYNIAKALGEQIAEECGYIQQMPEAIRYYFDAEAFGRDLLIDDFWECDGHVFRRF